MDSEQNQAASDTQTVEAVEAPAVEQPKAKKPRPSRAQRRERKMERLYKEYAQAAKLGHRGRLARLEEEIFLLEHPGNNEMVDSIVEVIRLSGLTATRAEYQKTAEETLLRAFDIAERRYRDGVRASFKEVLVTDAQFGEQHCENIINRAHRTDRRLLRGLLSSAQKMVERENRTEVNKAKHRLGAIFLNAIKAGCPAEKLPLWQVIAWSLYGRLPRPLLSWMDTRDHKVPEIWGPAISACPAGTHLHAISYGPGADRPKVNLSHLGQAYYGVVCLAGEHVQLAQRQVVGVLLLDRLGKEVIRFGEGVGMAPEFEPSPVLKGLDKARHFKGWDFPAQFAKDDKLKERIDTLCERADERGELESFGIE